MAIPEHDKCVKVHKRIRYRHHHGVWRSVRHSRRKAGKLKPRERIRTILKVETTLGEARLLKLTGSPSCVDMYKRLIGPHYRRWGKYDD